MAQGITPPFVRALVEPNSGRLTREGYTFLVSLNSTATAAGEGTITTAPGSGLAGGGVISNGVSLSVADNGVSNAMLRQSQGTSVIGRFAGSDGNVADIRAVSNGTVLTRQSNQLVFSPDLSITSIEVVDTVTDTFRINQAPVSEVVVCTHTITINVNGTNYKIPCVAA